MVMRLDMNEPGFAARFDALLAMKRFRLHPNSLGHLTLGHGKIIRDLFNVNCALCIHEDCLSLSSFEKVLLPEFAYAGRREYAPPFGFEF